MIPFPARRVHEGQHTHQTLKFSFMADEPSPNRNERSRARSLSSDAFKAERFKDELEVRTASNELPWETIGDQPERSGSGENLTRQGARSLFQYYLFARNEATTHFYLYLASGNRVHSPREAVPLHISSPFGIMSAGELKEKLDKSEKRNQELEAQVAELKVRSLIITTAS